MTATPEPRLDTGTQYLGLTDVERAAAMADPHMQACDAPTIEECRYCRNRLVTIREFAAAVTPVIRRQERAVVAEEIARAIGEECRVKLLDIPGAHMSAPTSPTLTARHTRDLVAAQAAAIARSHSTQPTEEETTR